MNDHGIIKSALQHNPTPRVPCFPLIDTAFASSHHGTELRAVQLDTELHAQALAHSLSTLPVDGAYINLSLKKDQVRQVSDQEYILDDILTLIIPENDVLSIKRTEITDLEDPRIVSAELFHPGMTETLQAMPNEILREKAIFPAITGTFSQLAFLYGVQNLMIALIEKPDAVKEALKRRHVTVQRQALEICRSGTDFVWIGEGLGSGSLISSSMYKEYVFPFESDLAQLFRQHGVLTLLHICGDTRAALPDIARTACDGFDFDYPVPYRAAADTLLPDMAVKGNINPAFFLKSSRDKLEHSVRMLLDEAAGTPGFILSTGCLVPRDADPEAFYLMSEIAERY